ncbi:type II toxin-antitoxin system TacA family antitoxin [Cellulomonas soli]
MATKTRRMEQRIDEETDVLLSRAAALTHESISAFVVRSARDEAARVLARSDLTVMPAPQFDQMLAALDAVPRRVPALVDAAARRRVFAHE